MTERLQKIIAQAGLASRREAEKMITAGRVSVNNLIVRQLGTKADIEKNSIRLDGALICPGLEKIYIMLNKPAGYVTTLHDPQGRPIVADLLSSISGRVFPVGRLDYDSEGLILLTNDGDFAQRILHPRFRMPKVYQVKIKGKPSPAELRALKKGIVLEDGIFLPEDVGVARVNQKSSWLVMTIKEGKNRILRRAFSSFGHEVVRLIRTRIGDLELGNLKTGAHRFLTKSEVRKLLSFSENDIPRKSQKISLTIA
jgi:23S rRNA pseudouridine2605 synthase